MVSTTFSKTQTSQLSSQQPKKTSAAPSSPLLASPFKRETMSLTQTYCLAHKVQTKLSAEAQKPDHDLRKLVGSANLLDALMLELADAETEQESWFNQSVRAATNIKSASSLERRVQWADTVVEEAEEDWEADDTASDSSDEDSELDDDEAVSLARVPLHITKPAATTTVVDEEEYYDEEKEDYASLSVTRSPSYSAMSPPGLDHDSSEEEDEFMPPSPLTATLSSFTEKQHQQKTEDEAIGSSEKSFYTEGYYVPPRNPARLMSAMVH